MSALLAALVGVVLPALRIVPSLWLATRAVAPLRAGLLVVVALTLAVGLRVNVGPVNVDAELLIAALRELSVGAALAVVLGAPLLAISVAGAWVDRPWATGDGPVGRLVSLVGAMTLLAAGAHRGALRALAATYDVWPATGRAWTARATWTTALRALTTALSAASTLAASVLLTVVAMELTVAVAGRAGRGFEREELRAPLREVVALGAVALALAGFTGALRAMAASALETVAALR